MKFTIGLMMSFLRKVITNKTSRRWKPAMMLKLTITIRYRDTMEQERVAIDQLHDILRKKTDLREILKEVKI